MVQQRRHQLRLRRQFRQLVRRRHRQFSPSFFPSLDHAGLPTLGRLHVLVAVNTKASTSLPSPEHRFMPLRMAPSPACSLIAQVHLVEMQCASPQLMAPISTTPTSQHSPKGPHSVPRSSRGKSLVTSEARVAVQRHIYTSSITQAVERQPIHTH